MFEGIKSLVTWQIKLRMFFFKHANLFILSGGHFINKISFRLTLSRQKYLDDSVDET